MKKGGNKIKVHYSSESNEWYTPKWLYDRLDKEYNFTLDPCATKESAKCDKYYTIEDDGLEQSWANETAFVNPPYGNAIKYWVEKAYRESLRGAVVVMLIPSRTETQYWHDYIMKYAHKVMFFNKRIKFERLNEETNSAPFPSALVVFDNSKPKNTLETYDIKKGE